MEDVQADLSLHWTYEALLLSRTGLLYLLSVTMDIDRFAKINVGTRLDGMSIWRMSKLILVFTGRRRYVLLLSRTGLHLKQYMYSTCVLSRLMNIDMFAKMNVGT